MKYAIIGAVLALAVASGIFLWINNRGVEAPSDEAEVGVHALTVELVAPVRKEGDRSSTDDPVVATTKMVAVKVLLQFTSEDAVKKAHGDMKQLRRAFGATIGTYLSNREKTATDDIETAIKSRVAKVVDEVLGIGVVTEFEVEGPFGDQPADQGT